jgi:hypothetical protein
MAVMAREIREGGMDEHPEGLKERMDERFDRVDERFTTVDQRFGRVEGEIKEIRVAIKDLHDDNKAMRHTMTQSVIAICTVMTGGFVTMIAALVGLVAL